MDEGRVPFLFQPTQEPPAPSHTSSCFMDSSRLSRLS
jgi:hypothetical protein